MSRTCGDCKYAIFQDVGYSSYTVEGTNFYCARHLHPNDGFDCFYGRDEGLHYAEQCAGYEAGQAIEMDVDRHHLAALTSEQKDIYESWPGLWSGW